MAVSGLNRTSAQAMQGTAIATATATVNRCADNVPATAVATADAAPVILKDVQGKDVETRMRRVSSRWAGR
jgi:hypothetical protein